MSSSTLQMNYLNTTSFQRSSLTDIKYPDPEFSVAHGCAIVVLGASIVAGVYVVVHLGKTHKIRKFHSWVLGERFIVYLAINDLLHSISHLCDHVVVLTTRAYPPSGLCQAFAFVLGISLYALTFLPTLAAMNAYVLIVRNVRLDMGRYDWKILSSSYGGGLLTNCIALGMGWFGQKELWCQSINRTFNIVMSIIGILMILNNATLYALVWLKIRQSSKVTASNSGQQRTVFMAKSLSLVVLVFILQWFPCLLYSIWDAFGEPPFFIVVLIVTLSNSGGVSNMVAYTLVKRLHKNKVQNQEVKDTNTERTYATTM